MELQLIQNKIHVLRGQRIMLDADLAGLYEVETRTLKQAVKRNLDRFPSDFMFELTSKEMKNLRSQTVTSSWGVFAMHPSHLPSKAWPCFQRFLKVKKQ